MLARCESSQGGFDYPRATGGGKERRLLLGVSTPYDNKFFLLRRAEEEERERCHLISANVWRRTDS